MENTTSSSVLEEFESIDFAFRPRTVKELWIRYQEHLHSTIATDKARQEIRLIQTALLRYTLPGWGGPVPLSERLAPNEIVAGLNFAESIGLVQFEEAIAVLETVIQRLQADYIQPLESEEAREKYFQSLLKRNKHYLSKLWNWVNKQGWFDPPTQEAETEINHLREKVEGKIPFASIRLTRRRQSDAELSDSTKLNNSNEQSRIDIFALGKVAGDVINPTLQTQIDDLRTFMLNGSMGDELRGATAQSNLEGVLQILGWFHRVEGVSPEDLRLETLVPFVKLRFSENQIESLDQWAIQSWFAREKSKRLADQLQATVRRYLLWRDSRIPGNPSLHPKTKLKCICAWLCVAKYIYRFETDQDEADNFEDIPAVRRLRKLSNELTKKGKITPRVVNPDAKMVEWPVLLSAVEKMRLEAKFDQDTRNKQKPSQFVQAKSMQLFLLLSFMTIMPPDRQRTYREMVVGRTLVKGQLVGSIFTPSERMFNPCEAKWYIHLEAPDYKTGNTYGEWWGEVPDVTYSDGKTFYGYIKDWITQWRQIFSPNHQCFFTQPNGKPMSDSSLGKFVKRTLYRLVHVPVTPHILRDIFVTYLYNQNVPGHVLDSAALAMHHSKRMQEKSYNRQKQFVKLLPSFSLSLDLVYQAVNS